LNIKAKQCSCTFRFCFNNTSYLYLDLIAGKGGRLKNFSVLYKEPGPLTRVSGGW
jgi:hypothetical protein